MSITIRTPVTITSKEHSGELTFRDLKDFLIFKDVVDKEFKNLSHIEINPQSVQVSDGLMLIESNALDFDNLPDVIVVGDKSYAVKNVHRGIEIKNKTIVSVL